MGEQSAGRRTTSPRSPHPLFEKSGAKTLIKIAHSRDFMVFCRTFFQKSSWGAGQRPAAH